MAVVLQLRLKQWGRKQHNKIQLYSAVAHPTTPIMYGYNYGL